MFRALKTTSVQKKFLSHYLLWSFRGFLNKWQGCLNLARKKKKEKRKALTQLYKTRTKQKGKICAKNSFLHARNKKYCVFLRTRGPRLKSAYVEVKRGFEYFSFRTRQDSRTHTSKVSRWWAHLIVARNSKAVVGNKDKSQGDGTNQKEELLAREPRPFCISRGRAFREGK